MLTQLTKAQESRFQEFRDKWLKIGLSTEPANRPLAEAGIRDAYKIAGLKPPRIVWCGSPLSQGLTRAIVFGLKENAGASVRDRVGASVLASVLANVRASVGDSVLASVLASVGVSVRVSVGASVLASVLASVGVSVGDSVLASVRDRVGASVLARVVASVLASVRDSVGARVLASVRDSVRDSVLASVGDSVRDRVGAKVLASVGASVGDSVYGQHDAGWLSFYDYFRIACSLEQETLKLTGLLQVSQNAGWWLPHQKLCWISERHSTLHRNERGQLHKDEAPALAYPDGWAIYALNGVRMKSEYVLTPSNKLTPNLILSETNADIRRELIRKIGIERFLSVAKHKPLHKLGDYELLSIELSPEIKDARFLKMLNPSIGTWHVEGVHPSCMTVQQAINWRASGDINKPWQPAILT